MNYHELQKTKVTRLREMAKEYPDVKGTTGMSKHQLIDLLCDKLGVERPHRVASGIDKAKVKQEIRALKKVREQALGARDRKQLHEARHKLHRLRHKLHKATKITA